MEKKLFKFDININFLISKFFKRMIYSYDYIKKFYNVYLSLFEDFDVEEYLQEAFNESNALSKY